MKGTMPDKTRRTRLGLGIDATGGPVIDPTENVIALTDAANKRQDDLRGLERELVDRDIAHIKEVLFLRAKHQKALDEKESGRLDSIRQVDREEVIKAAASAQQAIATLATSTTTVAETLRSQQDSKATAAEARLVAFTGEMSKRVGAVELALSEGRGKQAVADPMMAELVAEMRTLTGQRAAEAGKQAVTDPLLLQLASDVRALLQAQANAGGQRQGISLSWAVLIGAITLAGVLGYSRSMTDPGGALADLKSEVKALREARATPTTAPQVIYVPSPPGTMLPTTPPQPPPR
jgi:hypothetical protein